jgi:hypothetical protein
MTGNMLEGEQLYSKTFLSRFSSRRIPTDDATRRLEIAPIFPWRYAGELAEQPTKGSCIFGGGTAGDTHFIWYGYLQLKVQACTATIAAAPDNLKAYYWPLELVYISCRRPF